MELLLWLLVPVGYALGVLLAEALWRLLHPRPSVSRGVLHAEPDRGPIVLDDRDGRQLHAWG